MRGKKKKNVAMKKMDLLECRLETQAQGITIVQARGNKDLKQENGGGSLRREQSKESSEQGFINPAVAIESLDPRDTF